MGLMLSILVFCVGVIEALSCYEHFQYGVLHYATNVYENARRRSSLFLKYTSEKLKLLPEHSVDEYDENPDEILQPIKFKRESANGVERYRDNSGQIPDHFASVKKSKIIWSSTEKIKTLDKEEKIHIVKSLLEKPRKPKVVRSISMPELIYTEKDIELTNIIDNLAIEPIEEVNIEIEDANYEVLTKEFDKLFYEYENSSSNALIGGSSLNDLKEPISQNTVELNHLQQVEVGESKMYSNSKETINNENFENFQKDAKPDLISERDIKISATKITKSSPTTFEEVVSEKDLSKEDEKNYQIGRSTSVNFVRAPLSIRFNKSLSEDLDVSSYFSKKSNVSTESDSLLDELLVVDKSVSCNKLDETIFEYDTPSLDGIDTTFEEIYNDIWDESLDLTSTYEEIEKNILNQDDDFCVNLQAKYAKNNLISCAPNSESNTKLSNEKASLINPISCGKTVSSDVVVKAVEQLAELIVKNSLNLKKIKSLIFQNLTHLNTFNSNGKLGLTEIGMQSFDTSKQSQLERNTTAEEALHKSKCNVPIVQVENFNENKSGDENAVFRKLSNDKYLEENRIKISPAAEENDFANVRHEVKYPVIDSSILVKENLNLADDFIPEMAFTEPDTITSDYLISCTENLKCFKDEKQKPQGKCDSPDSALESTEKRINAFSKVEEIVERNVGEDSKEKIIKDFAESGNRKTENGIGLLLSYESKENGTEQVVKMKVKTENVFAEAGDKMNVKGNDLRDQKIEDLIKIEQKPKPVSIDLEKKTEIQSDVTNNHANSDDLSEISETSTAEVETLLILECNKETKSEENKKETISAEQRIEQDIGNKNSELQPVEIMESVAKEKLKLHEKYEEAEDNAECERVGTIGSNLAEAEGALNSEKSDAANVKEVNPDFSKVDLCSENKGEYSNASDSDTEVQSAKSAPEAFWLIFSGEYTKAMSKDWHSGHFSCWQCDEALTGQRYVLRDDHPYCIKCYESVFANVCEECNKIIGIDSKDLSYKDKHWHEACFLCNKCRVSLVDKQFGSKADKIYCGNCYDAQFASRCDGCGEIFRAGTKKMEYKTRQWHEKCFCCCVCKTPIGTKSFIPREQEIYCATCYEEKFATRCVKCNKIITSGGVTYKNEPWHRECFTCTNCNTSLAGQRFTSRDEKPYCADCFGELFAKRCTACSKPITGIGGTRFISFEDRHWHNDCFICASCKTSLVGRGFITDGDDIICPECAKQKLM